MAEAEAFKRHVEKLTGVPYPIAYQALIGPRLAGIWRRWANERV